MTGAAARGCECGCVSSRWRLVQTSVIWSVSLDLSRFDGSRYEEVSLSRLLLCLLALRDNSAYLVDRLRHPSFDCRFITAQLDRTARDGVLESGV